jgi:LytS/YehU family sensor histidine kinase
LNNIAGLYHLQKKYDEAIDFYLKNEIFRKEKGDSISLMIIWANLGETYYQQAKYDKAKEYYTQLEACAMQLKNEEYMVTAKKGLAQVEEKLKKVVDDKTIDETQKALQIAQKQETKDDAKELAVLLSSLYETQSKYNKALEYYKLAMSYKDSVISKESTSQMAKLMSKYQFTQQKRQIKKQAQTIQKKEQDLKSQRTITYLLLVVLAVMLVATYALFRFYKLRQQHAKSQLETKVAEGETRLLRAQMNPHFIFNSLNAIQSFIMMNNERMANRYLSRFSKLMRMFLESSRSQYTTISDEIELLDHYMELEKLRFEDKFDYEIEMDQALDAYNTEIPTMIIQPFIENAINHGFTHKKEKGMLKVAFTKDGDEISCTVEDNGIGRKKAAEFKQQSTKPQHVSRAMQIIEERLDLINTLENTNIGTTISDKIDQANESNGTKVEIRIPLWES